jgi:uncharacterized membrane protein
MDLLINWFDTNTILVAIGGIAITIYYGAIIYAGILSVRSPNTEPEIPEFLSILITTVSGTLATFLGMALGFKQAHAATSSVQEVAKVLDLSWPQAIAAWAYVVSLVVAVGFWAYCRFSKNTALTIQNLAKSLLGLFGGALAVLLNVQ